MAPRCRLDAELVRRELVSSRQEALEMIQAGRVLVNGAVAAKAAHLVAPADALVLSVPPRRFVSRGGEKLLAALGEFALPVEGLTAVDAGASTGGFTDCLLQHGARSVIAIDVGHGQLHPKIRNDERVTVRERVNIRGVTASDVDGPVDIVVADLSFISLTIVLPALVGLLKDQGHLVALIKPQFEVGRDEVSRGRGVITDPELHAWACTTVGSACEELGLSVSAVIPSPILGQEGNKEFLLHGVLHGRLRQ
jgi:23S rRNA (cytidine1920-2'-O)/16S rRNA (cytidine1409-2'-O)-methyltransferase